MRLRRASYLLLLCFVFLHISALSAEICKNTKHSNKLKTGASAEGVSTHVKEKKAMMMGVGHSLREAFTFRRVGYRSSIDPAVSLVFIENVRTRVSRRSGCSICGR